MSTWLKQSTAVDVGIGPFLDDTDGKTAETALTITQADIRLKKNGAAFAQKNAAQTLTHEENGWYEVALDATDTNTLGILILAIHEAGALPMRREFMVVPAAVYDSLVSGTGLGVRANVEGWGGVAVASAVILAAANFAAGAFDAVWTVTTRLLTAGTNIALAKGTGVTGFNDVSAAQVNAEVVDALNTDTYAEPAQGAPAATTTLVNKIGFLYKAWRNKVTQTATEYKLFADDTTTVDHKATLSDDATTFTKAEIATGP